MLDFTGDVFLETRIHIVSATNGLENTEPSDGLGFGGTGDGGLHYEI